MKGSSEATHSFIRIVDPLSQTINEKANELYAGLKNIDPSALSIDETFRQYFIRHHLGNRLFFSMQNSCHIIYESVQRTGKPIHELCLVDYGAGLGTLYMLSGKLGFRKTVYNDYLPEWKDTAKLVCEALRIELDGYVTGDIDAVTDFAENNGFRYDIIASRNVIEHIYSLEKFYRIVHRHNPSAVIYSTTTANFHNPAMWLKHYLLHRKVERKAHFPHRKSAILEKWPGIGEQQLNELAALTRGRALDDFDKAIEDYRSNNTPAPLPFLHSNTCNHTTGYWMERILKKKEHAFIATKAGFTFDFTPGYWDTHYGSVLMNMLARVFNVFIRILGKRGILLSPFVNIIACGPLK